jgi:HK97 family phage prohead protease
MMQRFDVKFDAAGVDQKSGTFEGYGAVFGNVDSYGDVIARGAFKATLRDWKKAGSLPPMLVQHGGWMMTDMDALPIGKWEAMEEDDTGLRVTGRLINLDTERGKQIYGAMREGVLDGMSIGYRAKEFIIGTKPEEPRRTLKQVELVELSVVTFPANGKARVDAVKTEGLSRRELERRLTQDAELPRSIARQLMAGGFEAIKATQDAGDEGDLSDLARYMRQVKLMKG